MKLKLVTILSIGLLVLLINCSHKIENKEINSAEVVVQVKKQVKAFHAADTALNAQGVIDLLWPEYTMLVDGKYIDYEEVITGSISFMASLDVFHTEWKELRIIPIGNSHAISSFIFTDSIVAKDGTITQSRGPNTFVWEKRDGVWKVIFGDADHYPIKQ
ncbi:MAG: nuclear transport factor 2 family protein [Flavobacteriaceae bacterium]|nr:nuclear transport factor 2 family protein [Flavobacteriaceae bacterium]